MNNDRVGVNLRNLQPGQVIGTRKFAKITSITCPELNPVEYAIWGIVEKNVYDGHQIEQFGEGLINGIINLWCRRIQDVVSNHGGHIHNILLYSPLSGIYAYSWKIVKF